ncbi:MAG: DNA gyrase inhibitor YacG [Alsobacter sp.]
MNDNEERPRREGDPEGSPFATKAACPQCGKPTMPAYRPFCSKRCADVDLSRWLNGVYAVAGKSTEEEADEDV